MVQIPCVIPSISREFNANYPNSQCDKTNITRHVPANYKLIAYIWTSTMRPQLSLIIDVPSINSNNLVDPPLVFSLFHLLSELSLLQFLLSSNIFPIRLHPRFIPLVFFFSRPSCCTFPRIIREHLRSRNSIFTSAFDPGFFSSAHKFELNRIYLACNSCPNLCSFRSTEK